MLCSRFSNLIQSLTIVAFSFVLFGCGEGSGPEPVVDPTPPAQELYTLVWSDEFNVDGPPDVRNWTMETGYGPDNDGWGNKEWQLYTNDTTSANNNVRVENGELIITARCSGTSAECANGATADKTGIITSARLISQNKVDVKYGNIQARIKTPPGKGTWPAFWMLGSIISNLNWPAAGEIDIMEMHQFFSNDRTTHFTVHYCDESLLPATDRDTVNNCFVNGGRVFDSRFLEFDLPLTTDYHIFELDWDQERVIGKIDGITYYSRSIDPETEEEFLRSFFLILNVAIGGDLGGPPSPDVDWTQQEMRVDWVRVYKKDIASSDLLEVVPEDPTQPLPFQRIINSVVIGGDSVVTDIASTAVTPLFGDTVVEFDYRTANTNFSGAAFNFKNVDLRNFTTFEFSLDRSLFTALKDITIEISDERFEGGAVGVVRVSLLNPPPDKNYLVESNGNWDTYQIPMSDFNGVDLENVVNVGLWNPVDDSDPPRLVAGKLYADGIKFKREQCTTEASVAFDSDFYNPETNVASVTIKDICNASRTASVKVETDTGAIGVGVSLDAKGEGTTNFNLANPNSVCSTDDTLQILKLSADSNPLIATYSRTDILADGGMSTVTFTDVAGVDENAPGTSIVGEKRYFLATDPDQELAFIPDVDYQFSPFGSGSTFDGSFPDSTFDPAFAVTSGDGYGGGIHVAQLVLFNGGGDPPLYPNFAGFAEGAETFNFKIKDLPANNSVTVGLGVLDVSNSQDNWLVDVTTSQYATAIGDGWYEVRLPMTLFPNAANYDYIIFDVGEGGTDQFTFLITDIFLQDPASSLPAECEVKPESVTLGVYSEVNNADPAIAYSRIVNLADDGGNVTIIDEFSTAVTAYEGSNSIEAEFTLTGAFFGGFYLDMSGPVGKPVGEGVDLTDFATLKFAINVASMPGFDDISVELESPGTFPDGKAAVPLNNYTGVDAGNDWVVYEIPLADLVAAGTNFDISDVHYVGFANPVNNGDTLINGTIYFDDIHFSKLPATPSLGVYSEVNNSNPAIAYSRIVNLADDGGNVTIIDEFSTAVTAYEGSNSIEAEFTLTGAFFGGFYLDMSVSVGKPVGEGVDLTDFATLKFAINVASMPGFDDISVELESPGIFPNGKAAVPLNNYIGVDAGNDWVVYEIPLADLIAAGTNFDISDVHYVGFANPVDNVDALINGTIYFDDIHFVK